MNSIIKKIGWQRIITSILFIISTLWILFQFIAPLMLPSGSINDLSGSVALLDNREKINEMDKPWGTIYTIGDRLCHQIASRSLFLNGNQMPFCVRCTAIWLGLSVGLGYMVFFKHEINEKILIVIIIGVAPMGVDGTGQLLGFWESTNTIRFITGLLSGLSCGLETGVIIKEILPRQSMKK
ncbi:MAG: DUF2085 domain-containing protein [Candidatus Thermoplasmatota archaeon]